MAQNGTAFQDTDETREALAREFYEIGDGRKSGDLSQLFSPDVEVFFPKYGVVRGFEEFIEFRTWVRQFVRSLEHQPEGFRVYHSGDSVIIEGTTRGETHAGQTWDGRVTVPGHYCSVFQIRNNQICRMYVYLDPDYGDVDASRYPAKPAK